MKKKLALLTLLLAMATGHAAAFDLKGLLGGSGNDDKGLGQVGDLISGVINQVTAADSITAGMLVGEWSYSKPAVSFASTDMLQNIGGAAMATTIENKLAPYYKTAGLAQLNVTIDDEANFTMTMKHGTLNGTIETGSDHQLIFNFKAFKSINIGRMAARAQLSGNSLDLTFDVSGLIKILKTVSQVANNSTFNAAVQLLESYDGLYAGFTLKRKK